MKYDDAGSLIWTRQIGTEGWDEGFGIAVDASGNVFMAGTPQGSIGGPKVGAHDYDGFLTKYDSNGEALWASHIGTTGNDICTDVAVDAFGNSFVTGRTDGWITLGFGSYDAFLIKFDSEGDRV